MLIAVAPLTNIALLFKLYPGISTKVKSLHIMGGSYLGVGNVSACAEFNFWSDPEAAQIVFTETKCPTYIFPWEPCVVAGDAMPFADWRLKELTSNNNPFTSLLDLVEIKAYKTLSHWTPCDCFLACCFIFPKMMQKVNKRHVTVELAGNHTRGQVVIDHINKNEPNAFIIEQIDVELFKKFMLWVCGHEVTDIAF